MVKLSASGRGTGWIINHPMIIGTDVPIASINKRSEVLPGKSPCAIVEKRNAESPKPEYTSPMVVVRCNKFNLTAEFTRSWSLLTSFSGKLFATALAAPTVPAAPPTPVRKLQKIIAARPKLEIGIPVPESKISFMPRYPKNSRTVATARGICGPLASTSFPRSGPELYTPT